MFEKEKKFEDGLDSMDRTFYRIAKGGGWLLLLLLLGCGANCGVNTYIKLNHHATHVYKIQIDGMCTPDLQKIQRKAMVKK